jgi:hypothetical protein
MRLVGYYERFIEGFSNIFHLVASLKKELNFNGQQSVKKTYSCYRIYLLVHPFSRLLIQMNILWYILMFSKRDLVYFLLRMDM